MSTLQRRIVIDESVTWANLDDEAILLNVKTGIYYGLDDVGTRIWRLLIQGATESEITSQLLTEYDVEPDRLRRDLFQLIGQLSAKGLVRISDE